MSYNPYSNQSISGYNSDPPSDDGTQTANNTVEWDKHKTKLTDPVRNYVDAIQTQVSSAFDERVFGNRNTQTTTYTVQTTDQGRVIDCSGTFTVTLLATSTATAGWVVIVENAGTGVITVDGNASETINGSATITLAPFQSALLQSDGSNWSAYYFNPRGNLAASAAPTVNDDTDAGYRPGSMWIDTTADKGYVCLDASDGAAVWQTIGGGLTQRVIGTYATYANTTTTIPTDDTIPQNTEGAEAATVAITPTSTTNRLRIRLQAMVSGSTGLTISLALFQDSTADALAATAVDIRASGAVENITLVHEMAAGTTSSTTFKMRFGPNSGTGYINGNSSNRLFGGVAVSSIIIDEIEA